MAYVSGRLTGKASVCLGTLGPGATNLVTGVADANMDRAPCIVVTGQADSKRQHKESHQNMDVVALFRPVTKWASPIINSANVPEVVRKAFKIATTEKPGACHIELAEDLDRSVHGGVDAFAVRDVAADKEDFASQSFEFRDDLLPGFFVEICDDAARSRLGRLSQCPR